MKTWITSLKNFWMALCRYLNQHLSAKDRPPGLDPWKFDRYNKIQFLENCWELDYFPKEKHS